MKDREFDKMGKRLFDLEADPPKDGWKKIGSALSPKEQSGKIIQLRKHWWKPLIVIIPASLYILYSSQNSNTSEHPATPAQELALSESTKKENSKSPQQPELEYAEIKSSKPVSEDSKNETIRISNNPSISKSPKTLKNSLLNSKQNNSQGLPVSESVPGKISIDPPSKNDREINSATITGYEKKSVTNASEERSVQTIIALDEKNNSNNTVVNITPIDSIHLVKNEEEARIQPAKNQSDSSMSSHLSQFY